MGKPRRVVRTCVVCNKAFTNEAKYPARYCSRECVWKQRGVPLEQRFWSRVDKNGPVPEHRPELGPCWIWTARRDQQGYGKIWHQGKDAKATVVVWILTYGVSGDGWKLHHCDNPPCVRPSHLFLGDAASNMADKMAKGRHRAGMLGKRSHRARFSDDDVRAIRCASANGATTYAIAKQFGIHDGSIRQILSGVTYRYVV